MLSLIFDVVMYTCAYINLSFLFCLIQRMIQTLLSNKQKGSSRKFKWDISLAEKLNAQLACRISRWAKEILSKKMIWSFSRKRRAQLRNWSSVIFKASFSNFEFVFNHSLVLPWIKRVDVKLDFLHDFITVYEMAVSYPLLNDATKFELNIFYKGISNSFCCFWICLPLIYPIPTNWTVLE